MKFTWKSVTTILSALMLSAAALAADVSPNGTWKWSTPNRRGGSDLEQAVKLELKDGQLTGTLLGGHTPMGDRPDVAISDGSYKDGEIKFTVTREFNGRSFSMKYDGKLEGDTIKGTIERGMRNGESRKSDWIATRAK